MKTRRPAHQLAYGSFLCAQLVLGAEDPGNAVPVIRVTAQRFTNSEINIPADITLINSETIERSQAQSVPELLQQKANVHVRSSNGKGNTGELSMRGFGENSGLRVLVIVDGQKMNRADMGLLDWQQLPLENIESVEIIRGGQTVLYGNHALSGVVKITTKKGGEQKTKLKASTGSYGFHEFNLFYADSTGDLFYTAGANYQRDDGFRDNSLSWSKNANLSLGSLLGDFDTISLRAQYGSNYIQLPGPLTYAQYRENPQQSSNAGDQYAHTTNALVTALWEGDRSWGSFQLNGGFNLRDILWEFSGSSGVNKQKGYSLSPQIRIGDEQSFVSGGLDFFYDTLDFEGDQGATINEAELSRITAGPFLFAQRQLSDSLSLSGGARYELAHTKARNRQYNKADFNPFIPNPWGPPIPNPNYPPKPDPAASFDGSVKKSGWAHELSLNWQPSESVSLWTGYDRVYRYPALDETASYQGFPLADPLNKNLDPEKGNGFEAGAKYRTGHWSASATLFYLSLDNEIGYDDTAKLNVNIGATERYGSDLEVSYANETFGLSTLCSWVNAEFSDGPNKGKTVPLVPGVQSVTSLWIQPVKPLRITGTWSWLTEQFQGGDFANTQRKIDSYGLLGLRADLSVSSAIRLFLKVENLADKSYVSSAYNGGYYPGSGRAFYAGASLEF
jgi:iron complex outermembrane recepter protein